MRVIKIASIRGVSYYFFLLHFPDWCDLGSYSLWIAYIRKPRSENEANKKPALF